MKRILQELLESLLRIGDQYPELYDSEVREHIGNVIMDGFVRNEPNYCIPDELGMFSSDGNIEVRAVLSKYINAANSKSKEQLLSFHSRLSAFQDQEVKTSRLGTDYEEFFGHTSPEFYDEQGNVIRTQ